MLKLVIADDEVKTLEGIEECLDWSGFGIEIAGRARNGLSALELVRKLEPDILLTDIKMPKLDGIELSMILREEFPKLKIIFITGYADLGYIKSAFKYDVIDYILKPVDPDELEAVVAKTADKCRLEKRMDDKREELEAKIRQSLPLLREKFFQFLISGEIRDRNEILERMAFLEANLPESGHYMSIIVNIDDFYLLSGARSVHEMQLLSYSVVHVAAEAVNHSACGIVFESGENEFSGILCFSGDADESVIEEKIETVANEIRSGLNNYLHLSVTIGVGEWVDQIERIASSYQSAKYAINQKLLVGKNKIIYNSGIKLENEMENPLNAKDAEDLLIALRLGSYERAEIAVSGIFNRLERVKSADRQYIHGGCLQVVSLINRVVNESGGNIADEHINIYAMVSFLFKLETIEDLKHYILSVCRTVCGNAASRQSSSSRKVIEDIKAIIYEKYGEDITINSIARDVYLTPSYICLLFKQETGETINGFLTRYRIEKAKEIMGGKTAKLYEICRQVGYSDPKYFSKIFKKYTGMNPSEYD
jgi:two-component system response regulator YesN